MITATEIRNTVFSLNDQTQVVARLVAELTVHQNDLETKLAQATINGEIVGKNEVERKASASLMFPELRQVIFDIERRLIAEKATLETYGNLWSMCRKLIDLEANELRRPELPETGNIELTPVDRPSDEEMGGEFPIIDSDVDEQTREIMGIEEELGHVDNYEESDLRQQELDEQARWNEEIAAEAEAEARMAQYDDDPSPYDGNYSEE